MRRVNGLVGLLLLLALAAMASPVLAAGFLKIGDIKGEATDLVATDKIPSPGQLYGSPGGEVEWPIPEAGVKEKGVQFTALGGESPMLTPDGNWSVDSFFDITYYIQFERAGAPPVNATGIGTGRVVGAAPGGGTPGTRVFGMEMLELNISGMLDPMTPFLLRESPTLASRGLTTIENLPGGQYRIDSFFDVFTELSLDGGQTWTPAIPEPSALALAALAAVALSRVRRRSIAPPMMAAKAMLPIGAAGAEAGESRRRFAENRKRIATQWAVPILVCVRLATIAAPASAAPITVTLDISAEDQYAVYHDNGTSLNWVTPASTWVNGVHTGPAIETWTISANAGDVLYVAALNADANPPPIGGMMVARATMGGTLAETGVSPAWTTSNQTALPTPFLSAPFALNDPFLLGVISGGWFAPAVGAAAGSAPGWPGGGPDPTASLAPAQFIWAQPGGSTGWGFSGYTSPAIAFFRLTAVPEPSALALAALGAIGIYRVRRHRRSVVLPMMAAIAMLHFGAAGARAAQTVPGIDVIVKQKPSGAPAKVALGDGGLPMLPPDFFGPGSLPFGGPLDMTLGTVTLGNDATDVTTFRRNTPGIFAMGVATIETELLQLSLTSVTPIEPASGSFFDVSINMRSSAPGQIRLQETSPTGGLLIDSFFDVFFDMYFVPRQPGPILSLSGDMQLVFGAPVPWTNELPGGGLPAGGTNFVLGSDGLQLHEFALQSPDGGFSIPLVTAVPEPASVALLATGACVFIGLKRRSHRQRCFGQSRRGVG